VAFNFTGDVAFELSMKPGGNAEVSNSGTPNLNCAIQLFDNGWTFEAGWQGISAVDRGSAEAALEPQRPQKLSRRMRRGAIG